MAFDPDALRRQIPYYLAADPAQRHLLDEVEALSNGTARGYFIPTTQDSFADEMLQGDGWQGFQVYSFETERKVPVRGIVLSNSCDVSTENRRVRPPKVVFAPIIRLSKVVTRFEDRGLDGGRINDRIASIKRQQTSNVFYLPAGGPLSEDYVVFLDDLHSMPIEAHRKTAKKLFTLSMAGFYLFVFKLSVHFCRLHENVDRGPSTTSA